MNILAIFLLLGGLSQAPAQSADMILVDGKIFTLDEKLGERQAIAMKGGVITAVGTNAEIRKLAGASTKVVDLHGALAVPGLIEGHGHFMGVGEMQMQLNLRDARSWDEIVAKVGEAAKKAKPGEWILGRGWHQEKWDHPPTPSLAGFPVHEALSKVSPDNPVILEHASGHAAFVNAAALKRAGVTRDTPNPPGGEIAKDSAGNPSGLLNERASGLVGRARAADESKLTAKEREDHATRAAELAAAECLSKGLTSFQDAGEPLGTVDLIRKLSESRSLGIRMWVMLRDSPATLEQNIARYKIADAANGFFAVNAIKLQLDGALGSRGAWFLEPYSDQPGTSGLNTEPMDNVRRVAKLAIENGFQLCVHAIGDRANRETLDVFQQAFEQHPDKHDLRWRIEHAQHLSTADIPRFGKLGVIASMQGIHATSDARFVVPRLGAKRAEEGAYVWRKLMDSGAVVTNGTDAPVEDVDPLANFYATVTRRSKDGKAFYPDQKMTRMEALRSYTIQNAYAAFQEKSKGTLAPGKFADITVIDRDILTVPDSELLKARVAYTIVAGKIAYQKQNP